VINGIVAAAMLAVMMWLASQHRIMGDFTIGLPLRIGGWIAAAVVAASVVAIAATAVTDLAV
jgi:hypothetical protein